MQNQTKTKELLTGLMRYWLCSKCGGSQILLIEYSQIPGTRRSFGTTSPHSHDNGYPTRTGEQIHAKIQCLKALHRTLHDWQNTSGEAAVGHPFLGDLQDILGVQWCISNRGVISRSMPSLINIAI